MPSKPLLSSPLDLSRDPSDMTPDERRQAVAAILARGVIRLLDARAASPVRSDNRDPEESSKCLSIPLDLPAGRSVHADKRRASGHARNQEGDH